MSSKICIPINPPGFNGFKSYLCLFFSKRVHSSPSLGLNINLDKLKHNNVFVNKPLGTSFKTASIWNPIPEKMGKKLSRWKHLYLSKGGRLALLKNTLSSLLTFLFFSFLFFNFIYFLFFVYFFFIVIYILIAMAARFERIQRNFLWGSSEGSFKYPLVAWDKVCSPIEMGGLGIRNVVSFNQVLLGKWLWRYRHEVSHLWRRVISTKYGEGQGSWSTKVCRRTHGCGLWHSINEGWENFSKQFSFVLGDGT